MINLLSQEHKNEIRAGRTNVLLVRYIAILVVAAIILSGLVVAAYFALDSTKAYAMLKDAENKERLSEFQVTKFAADEFRNDLATAKTILDSNVSFSKLIYEIADTVPSGVVLDDLTLDPATFGSSVTLNASAKTFTAASQLDDAFRANDQVFSNVQVQAIRSSGVKSTGEAYPFKVTFSVVINKGSIQ